MDWFAFETLHSARKPHDRIIHPPTTTGSTEHKPSTSRVGPVERPECECAGAGIDIAERGGEQGETFWRRVRWSCGAFHSSFDPGLRKPGHRRFIHGFMNARQRSTTAARGGVWAANGQMIGFGFPRAPEYWRPLSALLTPIMLNRTARSCGCGIQRGWEFER